MSVTGGLWLVANAWCGNEECSNNMWCVSEQTSQVSVNDVPVSEAGGARKHQMS
jgi:hypothetical protein